MREIFRKDSLVVGELDLNEIESYIEELAKMRIEAFCEYPYLYAGSIEYELEYLKSYTTCTDICVQILSDNGQICGMITSMPMEHSWDELCGDLDNLGVDSCKYFYVCELIIQKEYRN